MDQQNEGEMMDDRELLEMAAKAAFGDKSFIGDMTWNPLTSDSDALRLAVKLRMIVRVEDYGASARIEGKPHGAWNGCEAHLYGGIESATRRCIVRAAAEIARAGAQKG